MKVARQPSGDFLSPESNATNPICYDFYMPGLLTHYCFAKHKVKSSSNLVYVGTQGPDIFFAYGNVPFTKREYKDRVPLFGNTLHAIDPAVPYYELFKIARESKDREILSEYLDGVLMHYALDLYVHPYVFYRSGWDADPEKYKKCLLSHNFFETFLDKAVMTQFCDKTKPHKTMPCSDEEAIAIDKMWMELNKRLSIIPQEYIEGSFVTALKDYRLIHRILLSKTGIKRGLIGLFLGKQSKAYAYSYPRNINQFGRNDYMNLGHSQWRIPSDGETRYDSLRNLFDFAYFKYTRLKSIKEKAMEGEDCLEEFKAETAGYTHNGNNVKDPVMKYFDLAWKDKKKPLDLVL